MRNKKLSSFFLLLSQYGGQISLQKVDYFFITYPGQGFSVLTVFSNTTKIWFFRKPPSKFLKILIPSLFILYKCLECHFVISCVINIAVKVSGLANLIPNNSSLIYWGIYYKYPGLLLLLLCLWLKCNITHASSTSTIQIPSQVNICE